MHKESLVAYQEVLEIIPNDADTYMGMGITYWKMNEKQLARASWEKSLELKPNNNECNKRCEELDMGKNSVKP